MGELLLELLSEEIPARMQRRAIDDLIDLIRDKLAAADIPATSLAGYVTPRRLTVIADGIPARQPDREEERRGPRLGAPEQAIAGFLRATGLTSIDQCETRGEFYFAVIKRPGGATAEVLPELIHAAMTALPWPKSMRYPASELSWVRPLNSVICLFDGEVLKLPLGAVPVGRVTRGHRFLSKGEISVANAADYQEKLAKAHVVLDWNERRAKIDADLKEQAAGQRLSVKPDEGLLDEVAGLVEYPVVLMGSIDADFVRPLPDGLPPEVMATAMRTHQKYFSCLNPDGTPSPHFLFVANNVTADSGTAIVAGNERVLRARLSDAKFFWDQDRKIRLEDRVEALKTRVYHEKLGSVYDKVERMERLAEFTALHLHADERIARQAARLTKADLSTGMVGEFPELQGVMGRYYALTDGVGSRVADAIAEHYKPLGPNDTCPVTRESAVVALTEKMDALAAFFAVGERPTGSSDPFALRRAAQGIIRIILEKQLRLSLTNLLGRATELVAPLAALDGAGVGRIVLSLMHFVGDRLNVHLRGEGVRHDLINAVLTRREDDLIRLLARVAALQSFLDTDDGINLLTAYRRASNIVDIEQRKDNRLYTDAADSRLLREPQEKELYSSLRDIGSVASDLVRDEKFENAMAALATLRQPVDEFFERVTVNVANTHLRENRLRLLARIRSTMNQIADFSQIEG